MPDADRPRRVEMLEETLKSLRDLPDDVRDLKGRVTGVEVQVLQLHTEMRDEFFAIRGDMAGLTTKTELAEGLDSLKKDLVELRTELREDIAGMGRDLANVILEFQRHTNVQFEAIQTALKTRAEGNPQR